MEVTLNYWAMLVSAVAAMVIGYLWYGPLFGKKWMEIVGATNMDKAERKKMQASAGPLYVVQFILTLFQVYVLAHFIKGWQAASGLGAVFNPSRVPINIIRDFWFGAGTMEIIIN